jgi:hypothetical protein
MRTYKHRPGRPGKFTGLNRPFTYDAGPEDETCASEAAIAADCRAALDAVAHLEEPVDFSVSGEISLRGGFRFWTEPDDV